MRPTHRTPEVHTAIAYIRVSTDDQALSVAAQRTHITTWCAARQLSLIAVHEDIGVSGGARLEKRLGLMAAIDHVTRGCALVAMKRDRLARDAMYAAMITRFVERQGGVVLTCDGALEGDTPEAALCRSMVDVFAEYERAIIRARTTAALDVKHDRGERRSRFLPYGMKLAADGVHLEADPHEQAVIAKARALRKQGLSSRKIADALADNNMFSRSQRVFAASSILGMIEGTAKQL